MSSNRLGDGLVRTGRITKEQLQQGLSFQKEKGGRLGSDADLETSAPEAIRRLYTDTVCNSPGALRLALETFGFDESVPYQGRKSDRKSTADPMKP